MRSVTITHGSFEERETRIKGNYGTGNLRLDYPNQAYDLSRRGAFEGPTKKRAHFQEFTNGGFDATE